MVDKEKGTREMKCNIMGCGNIEGGFEDGICLPCYSFITTGERAWVGLTDEEIAEIKLKTFDAVATNHEVYRAIEAKLKDKNR